MEMKRVVAAGELRLRSKLLVQECHQYIRAGRSIEHASTIRSATARGKDDKGPDVGEGHGDRVIACRSWSEANEALAIASSCEQVPHIIASPVILPEGDGISFYLAARRRFPNIRWNVTSPGRHSVAPTGDEPSPLPDTSSFDLQSLPTPQVGTSHTPN